ncbi:MAG: hypothetical protein SFY56_02210 [Bacteroidota bacterium]|nr:hypothetical protein [Bacteroidota bacterium]
MKTIWIEGYETAGLIHDLKEGFKNAGYNVITFAEENKFYNYTYDINKYNFVNDLIKLKLLRFAFLTRLVLIFINKFKPEFRYKFLRKLQINILIKKVDFYLPIYDTHFIKVEDFERISKNGIKIIGYFLGSEIRIYNLFCKQFDVEGNLLGEYLNESFVDKAKKLHYFEKFAHLIYSVPDQMSLSKRPYLHLQLPFNTDKFTFNPVQLNIPRILHCPSNTDSKGTSIVLKIIEELKNEGVQFQFQYLKNMPHSELIKCLSESDILIDELFCHGPGLLAFEAMASGCVVLTRYYEESPNCFRPPIISVTKYNLKPKLKEVVEDIGLRKTLALKGRDYLLKNNALNKVIQDMIVAMEKDKDEVRAMTYDYTPDFNYVKENMLTKEQIGILERIKY